MVYINLHVYIVKNYFYGSQYYSLTQNFVFHCSFSVSFSSASQIIVNTAPVIIYYIGYNSIIVRFIFLYKRSSINSIKVSRAMFSYYFYPIDKPYQLLRYSLKLKKTPYPVITNVKTVCSYKYTSSDSFTNSYLQIFISKSLFRVFIAAGKFQHALPHEASP